MMAFELPPALAGRPELASLCCAMMSGARARAAKPTVAASRAAYRNTLAHNLMLGHALDQALAALGAVGVTVQPAKGALFVELLYGRDGGARPMSDLDLLVRPRDLEAAHAVLIGLGYRAFGLGRPRWSERFTHHRLFSRGRVLIELHWKLVHELEVDGECEAFFQQTRVIPFRGRLVEVARDELLLYHTLLHAGTHGLLHSAVWIVDARLLAERAGSALDWDFIERYARAHHAWRAVQAAARLVNGAFPLTLPGVAPAHGAGDRALAALLARGRGPLRDGPHLRSLAIRALLTDSPLRMARWLLDKARLRLLEAWETSQGR